MIRYAAFATLLLTCACGSSGDDAGAQRRKIRETVTVASAPAAMIAGVILPKAAVEHLGLGTDPANYSPTDEDLGSLATARRVLLVGAEFEPWSQRAGLPPSRTLTLSEGLPPASLMSTETVTHTHGKGPAHQHGGAVPTIWTDPALLRGMVHGAGELLAGVLPEEVAGTAEAAQRRREQFELELADYEAALGELKAAAGGRTIFTVANGLEYLARAADAPLYVALLEVQEGGRRNDHAASLLEAEVAKSSAHAGVLVWPGPNDDAIDETFAAIAERSLGLTSVSFDLGRRANAGAPTPTDSLLARLAASTRRLAGAVQKAPR